MAEAEASGAVAAALVDETRSRLEEVCVSDADGNGPSVTSNVADPSVEASTDDPACSLPHVDGRDRFDEDAPTNASACSTAEDAAFSADQGVLLSSLAAQLEYYFSPANLTNDTYLRTIMDLNSGYVPTTVLATFSNINRIIAQHHFDTGYVVWNVPELLTQAVLTSQTSQLEVVLIDTNGVVVPDTAAQTLTLLAVGPRHDLPHHHPSADDTSKSQTESSPDSDKTQSVTGSSSPERSTVILRDMPQDATDDEVRQIFTDDGTPHGPVIHDMYRDVGNCWFVTLEPTTKDEIVRILLGLRDKTFRGESVKARLKTKTHSMEASNSAPSSPHPTFKKLPPTHHSAKSLSGDSPHGRIPIYSGDRAGPSYAYTGKHVPKSPIPASPTNRRSGSNHLGGRGFGGGSKPGRGSNSGREGKALDGTNNNSSVVTSDSPSTSSHSVRAVRSLWNVLPPPPLLEEHYPTLSDGTKDKRRDSATDQDEKLTATTAKGTNTSPVVVTNKGTVGGYAAALLKTAPPVKTPSLPPTTPTGSEQSLIGSGQKKQLKRSKKEASTESFTKTATVTTDDSSADDKSSLSSKPESEKGCCSSTTAAAWGEGRSFADIVKRETQGSEKSDTTP